VTPADHAPAPETTPTDAAPDVDTNPRQLALLDTPTFARGPARIPKSRKARAAAPSSMDLPGFAPAMVAPEQPAPAPVVPAVVVTKPLPSAPAAPPRPPDMSEVFSPPPGATEAERLAAFRTFVRAIGRSLGKPSARESSTVSPHRTPLNEDVRDVPPVEPPASMGEATFAWEGRGQAERDQKRRVLDALCDAVAGGRRRRDGLEFRDGSLRCDITFQPGGLVMRWNGAEARGRWLPAVRAVAIAEGCVEQA